MGSTLGPTLANVFYVILKNSDSQNTPPDTLPKVFKIC